MPRAIHRKQIVQPPATEYPPLSPWKQGFKEYDVDAHCAEEWSRTEARKLNAFMSHVEAVSKKFYKLVKQGKV